MEGQRQSKLTEEEILLHGAPTVGEVIDGIDREIKKKETATKILGFFQETNMTIFEAVSTLDYARNEILQARINHQRNPVPLQMTVS